MVRNSLWRNKRDKSLDNLKLNFNEKRVLVTGGAGFIGSEVVAQLLKKGAIISILDNFSSGKKQYLPRNKKLKVFKVDINPIDRWKGTPIDDSIREGYKNITEYLKMNNGKPSSI